MLRSWVTGTHESVPGDRRLALIWRRTYHDGPKAQDPHARPMNPTIPYRQTTTSSWSGETALEGSVRGPPPKPRRFGARSEAWPSRSSTRTPSGTRSARRSASRLPVGDQLPQAGRYPLPRCCCSGASTGTGTPRWPGRAPGQLRRWRRGCTSSASAGALHRDLQADALPLPTDLLGPAIYHIVNTEDLQAKMKEGGIHHEPRWTSASRCAEDQALGGALLITFHCTPKEGPASKRVSCRTRRWPAARGSSSTSSSRSPAARPARRGEHHA